MPFCRADDVRRGKFQVGEGLKVFVRVTPNAGDDRIEDIVHDADGRSRLKVRVQSVPIKTVRAGRKVFGW